MNRKALLKDIRKSLSFLGKDLSNDDIINQSLVVFLDLMDRERFLVQETQSFKEDLIREHQRFNR